jgi:hypothetical protein
MPNTDELWGLINQHPDIKKQLEAKFLDEKAIAKTIEDLKIANEALEASKKEAIDLKTKIEDLEKRNGEQAIELANYKKQEALLKIQNLIETKLAELKITKDKIPATQVELWSKIESEEELNKHLIAFAESFSQLGVINMPPKPKTDTKTEDKKEPLLNLPQEKFEERLFK